MWNYGFYGLNGYSIIGVKMFHKKLIYQIQVRYGSLEVFFIQKNVVGKFHHIYQNLE